MSAQDYLAFGRYFVSPVLLPSCQASAHSPPVPLCMRGCNPAWWPESSPCTQPLSYPSREVPDAWALQDTDGHTARRARKCSLGPVCCRDREGDSATGQVLGAVKSPRLGSGSREMKRRHLAAPCFLSTRQLPRLTVLRDADKLRPCHDLVAATATCACYLREEGTWENLAISGLGRDVCMNTAYVHTCTQAHPVLPLCPGHLFSSRLQILPSCLCSQPSAPAATSSLPSGAARRRVVNELQAQNDIRGPGAQWLGTAQVLRTDRHPLRLARAVLDGFSSTDFPPKWY